MRACLNCERPITNGEVCSFKCREEWLQKNDPTVRKAASFLVQLEATRFNLETRG